MQTAAHFIYDVVHVDSPLLESNHSNFKYTECEVIWTDLIHIRNPQTAGGENGYNSHHLSYYYYFY